MIGNVVLSEVNAFRYDVLIKAEKHKPYEELDVTREMYKVIAEVSYKLSLHLISHVHKMEKFSYHRFTAGQKYNMTNFIFLRWEMIFIK